MGVRRSRLSAVAWRGVGSLSLLICCGLVGCSPAQPGAVQRLIAHQALLDFAGLGPVERIDDLDALGRLPIGWDPLPLQTGPLYQHRQWRSPSHNSGVGVASVHLPIPLSAKWILWFAKMQYARRETKTDEPAGSLLAQWTDTCGREWFEAENDRYHVRGYVVTSNSQAWIVYSGYRRKALFDPVEEGLAARSMETILPLPMVDKPPSAAAVASARTGSR